MSKLAEPATKRDVEEIVGRVVGEIVSDALNLIAEQFNKVSERFDKVDERFDKQDEKIETIETTVLKTDNRLDAANVVQEDHGVRIKKLEAKFA